MLIPVSPAREKVDDNNVTANRAQHSFQRPTTRLFSETRKTDQKNKYTYTQSIKKTREGEGGRGGPPLSLQVEKRVLMQVFYECRLKMLHARVT